MVRKHVGKLMVVAVGLAIAGSSLLAGGRDDKPGKSKLVTLQGTVVDLYSYMTGQGAASVKNPADQAKLGRETIKNGMTACLETEDGIVLLGKGPKAPTEMVLPLVFQEVEIRGKLYEKGDLQFVDIVSIRPLKDEGKGHDGKGHEGEPGHAAEDEEGADEEESEEEEP